MVKRRKLELFGAALVGAGVEPPAAGVEDEGLWRHDEKGKRVTREYDTNRRC